MDEPSASNVGFKDRTPISLQEVHYLNSATDDTRWIFHPTWSNILMLPDLYSVFMGSLIGKWNPDLATSLITQDGRSTWRGSAVEIISLLKTDKTSFITASIFALSFVLVGLPLWWKTTEVYRVSLPYNEITELTSVQIGHVIPVSVVLADRTVHESDLWEHLTWASDMESERANGRELLIQYSWKMRVADEGEEKVLLMSNDIHDIDERLKNTSRIDEIGEIQIMVLEKNLYIQPKQFIIGSHRCGYLINHAAQDPKNLAWDILSLAKIMAQSDALQKLFTHPSSYERKKPDKDRMRSLSTTVAFDVTFSLIVPEPDQTDVHWNIEDAVNAYVMPFVQKLSSVAEVDIKSQVLYMMPLPIQPFYNSVKEEYYLLTEQLSSIINPVEAKLGSYASVNPTLNFVVCIPPEDLSPLRIYDEDGSPLPTNAFLSPRWGGFLIQNVPKRNESESFPRTVHLNMQEVMEVFLTQLRLLIGLPDKSSIKTTAVQVIEDPLCSEWELDFLIRKHCQEQLSTAISSLYSLGQLLQTISNIVIKDNVGEKIYSSVSAVKESIYYLQQGFLEGAYLNAKRAFVDSETAFFDPSLLAFLYFPDDQKYAIYIPLFLPISIPVVISLRHIWLYLKAPLKDKEKVD